MCLAIPGKVVQWLEREPPFRQAAVQFGQTRRVVSMECVPDAELGDFVLVHAGIAINAIDAEEADRVLQLLEELEMAEAFEPSADDPPADEQLSGIPLSSDPPVESPAAGDVPRNHPPQDHPSA